MLNELILGPQVPITNSYFDQILVTKGRKHGESSPESPPTEPNALNSFILQHYYDLSLSMYIAYTKTGDESFLILARKCADAWWKMPEWIGEGKIREWVQGNAAPAPRHAGLGGLMLRALDGRPEMWNWIVEYVQAHLDLWCKSRINNSQLWYGPREVAFCLQHAAWVVDALPSTYPNASQIRSQLISDLENLAVNYTGRLQYPDGSWRDTSDWVDSVRVALSHDAQIQATELKVHPLVFPISAGQKVGFMNGGVTKTTKSQSTGDTTVFVEPMTVSRAANDVFYVEDGTMVESMQPFIVGLLISALVDVRQVVQTESVKENLKNQILKACRHLYNDGPYAKDLVEQRSGKRIRGFHYFYHGGTTLNPSKYKNGDMVAPWTDFEGWWVMSTRQAIATIVPSFAYAYKISGDQFFKDAGNELRDSAYSGNDGFRAAMDDTPKNFNQHVRRGGSYPAWLGDSDPIPAPQPVPEPVPTPTPTPNPNQGKVTLVSPANGSIVSGTISVDIQTEGIEVDSAYLVVNNETAQLLPGPRFDTTKLPDGTYSIFARVWTSDGKPTDSLKGLMTVKNSPDPNPTPTPIPNEPKVGDLRKDVPWTISEAKDNAENLKQNSEGFYFRKHQTGKKATFIYTGVKL